MIVIMRTSTKLKPASGMSYQAVAVGNVNLFLSVSREKKKDLAAYMGKQPTAMPRMLDNNQTWFYEDMCNAASFFGIGLDTLQRRDLTYETAKSIWDKVQAEREEDGGGLPAPEDEKTAAPNKEGNGLHVAGSGFEPLTSGL